MPRYLQLVGLFLQPGLKGHVRYRSRIGFPLLDGVEQGAGSRWDDLDLPVFWKRVVVLHQYRIKGMSRFDLNRVPLEVVQGVILEVLPDHQINFIVSVHVGEYIIFLPGFVDRYLKCNCVYFSSIQTAEQVVQTAYLHPFDLPAHSLSNLLESIMLEPRQLSFIVFVAGRSEGGIGSHSDDRLRIPPGASRNQHNRYDHPNVQLPENDSHKITPPFCCCRRLSGFPPKPLRTY